MPSQFVYLNPQAPAYRIVLPLIAMPFGGKLPKFFSTLQNILIETFGIEAAHGYFVKIIMMIPMLLLFLIAGVVSNFVSSNMKQPDQSEKPKKKTTKKADTNGKSNGKSRSKKTN